MCAAIKGFYVASVSRFSELNCLNAFESPLARDILVRTLQGEKQVNHAALLLYTERLARERGRKTVLTPQVECVGFHPDLWIDAGDWSMYVEVESRYRAHSNQWYKWKAALRAQGYVGIVAVLGP